MNFKWNLSSSNPDQIKKLVSALEVSPLIAQLLLQRGFEDIEEARLFLNPCLEHLHDPYLMTDMDRVVERIFLARDRNEKVLIYGDYDVDGITSTAVLKRALEMLGLKVDFYLPRRLEEGYGIQAEVLRQAHADGYSLIVTTDSGIRAVGEADVARKLGLDLIITDHHQPDASLPNAYAILDPCRLDCSYPDKNLAAVGVVFKLVQALFQTTGNASVVPHFLKLVAIGTIADVVPLVGENRIIVRYGLEGLADPRNVGLKELLSGAGVNGRVDLVDVAFKLAPRINAVTRMGGGREVVDLFFLEDQGEAARAVQLMNTKNSLRQKEEKRILSEIEEWLEQDPAIFEKDFLVVIGKDWHRGVIGIVAARLAERFYRPTLVLSLKESSCQGSGRSIPGYNMLSALDQCRDMFAQYGGHAQAVGCTLRKEFCRNESIENMAHRLEAHTEAVILPEDLVPSLQIESFLRLEEVSNQLCDEIEKLAPFGTGNSTPVFASRNVNLVAGPWVLKEKHLKIQLQCNGALVDAIWWKNGDVAASIAPGSQLDLAYTISRDTYRGQEKLLLTIRDLNLP